MKILLFKNTYDETGHINENNIFILRRNFFHISLWMHYVFRCCIWRKLIVMYICVFAGTEFKSGLYLYLLAQTIWAVTYSCDGKYGGSGILKLGIENVAMYYFYFLRYIFCITCFFLCTSITCVCNKRRVVNVCSINTSYDS